MWALASKEHSSSLVVSGEQLLVPHMPPLNSELAHVLSLIIGFSALALLIYTFIFIKAELGIKIALTTFSGLFFLHFILINVYAGAYMSLFGCARGIFSLFAGKRPWVQHLGWPTFFTGCALVISFLTWTGPESLLPALALSCVTWSLWQPTLLRLRLFCLAGSPIWITYSSIVGSLPAILADSLSCIAILISLYRFHYKPWKQSRIKSLKASSLQPSPVSQLPS